MENKIMNCKKLFLLGLLLSGSTYTVHGSAAAIMAARLTQEGAKPLAPMMAKGAEKVLFPFVSQIAKTLNEIGLSKTTMGAVAAGIIFQGVNSQLLVPAAGEAAKGTFKTLQNTFSFQNVEDFGVDQIMNRRLGSTQERREETLHEQKLANAAFSQEQRDLKELVKDQTAAEKRILFYGVPGTRKSEFVRSMHTKEQPVIALPAQFFIDDNVVLTHGIHSALKGRLGDNRDSILLIDEAGPFFAKGINEEKNKTSFVQIVDALNKLRAEGYKIQTFATVNKKAEELDLAMASNTGRLEPIEVKNPSRDLLKPIIEYQISEKIKLKLRNYATQYYGIPRMLDPQVQDAVKKTTDATMEIFNKDEQLKNLPTINPRHLNDHVLDEVTNPLFAMAAKGDVLKRKKEFNPHIGHVLGLAAAGAVLYMGKIHEEPNVSGAIKTIGLAYLVGGYTKALFNGFQRVRRERFEFGTIDPKTEKFTSKGTAHLFNLGVFEDAQKMQSMTTGIKSKFTFENK